MGAGWGTIEMGNKAGLPLGIGLGLALGAALGLALDNMALGISLGVAIGAFGGGAVDIGLRDRRGVRRGGGRRLGRVIVHALARGQPGQHIADGI